MTTLDAEELLHLGLHASQNNKPEDALIYLKQSLEIEPDNTKAVYLLAANYAQVGMYERAKELFQRTLELAPKEYTAAFQLGLLHMTSGDIDASQAVWSRLDELGTEHGLHKFKSALLALAGNDIAACIALIDDGMLANDFNPALNNDMQRIREAATTALTHSATIADVHSEPALQPEINHFMLNSYQQSREKK